MNARQQRFVLEYCIDLNATQAAIRAGFSERSAGTLGHELLKNADVAEAIAQRQEDVAIAAGITQESVLRLYYQIATADPAELCRVDTDCCRFCWGTGYAYHWTEAEYQAATEKAIEGGKTPPDGMGGFGFDPRRDPNPDCPECHGHGVEEVRISDTRKLKGSARRLFAGVKRTKNGIEVQMRDQDNALDKLARYIGLDVEKREISGSLGITTAKAEDLTDDQLAAIAKIAAND